MRLKGARLSIPSKIAEMITNGVFVATDDADGIAQVGRSAAGGRGNHGVEQLVLALEFAGDLHGKGAALGAVESARDDRVASGNGLGELLGGDAELRKFGRAVVEVNGLRDGGDALGAADGADLAECVLEILRDFFELAVGEARDAALADGLVGRLGAD